MANDKNFGGNLTPRARQVFELARKEADRFNHDYLGTEHLLLGILALGEGVAVEALKSLGDMALHRNSSGVVSLVCRSCGEF